MAQTDFRHTAAGWYSAASWRLCRTYSTAITISASSKCRTCRADKHICKLWLLKRWQQPRSVTRVRRLQQVAEQRRVVTSRQYYWIQYWPILRTTSRSRAAQMPCTGCLCRPRCSSRWAPRAVSGPTQWWGLWGRLSARGWWLFLCAFWTRWPAASWSWATRVSSAGLGLADSLLNSQHWAEAALTAWVRPVEVLLEQSSRVVWQQERVDRAGWVLRSGSKI